MRSSIIVCSVLSVVILGISGMIEPSMNSSRVKLTTFVECHAFCEKFRALELQTLLCLHLNVLLYVTYYLLHDHSYHVVALLFFARINHSAE